MALELIKVPDIGDYKNVDVIEVNVTVGDTIAPEDPIITLETDKATMDIPAPMAGIVKEIVVKEGDKVSEGDLILKVDPASPSSSDDTAEDKEASQDKSSAEAKEDIPDNKSDKIGSMSKGSQSVGRRTDDESTGMDVLVPEDDEGSEQHPHDLKAAGHYAAPGVRRLARELGIDLSQVNGSGRKGRITQDDLNQFIKAGMQGGAAGAGLDLLPDPQVDFAKFGPVNVQPLSRIKKISGANLYRNWVKIPHVTFFEDADITELEAFRKAKKAEAEKRGLKLTPVPFLVKAVAKALRDYPDMNSSLTSDGQSQVMKNYVHVGVAVDTPHGLMVPVIRDCDKKSLFEITSDFLDLVNRARDGKLKGEEMQGGCFTISSLGGIGTHGFTPIVNMPEVGILGVSKAFTKAVFDGKDSFKPRLMLPLSLSVDHRVIDGALAGQFVVAVSRYLSDIRELLL